MITFPTFAQIFAAIPTLLGMTACYLASPHRWWWRERALPTRALAVAGCALLLLGAVMWTGALGAAAGLTAWLTAAMLAAAALPYLALWTRRPQ